MTTAETKTKGMCIATRCTSVEQFVQMFHRFVDEESFFVSTLNTRAPGLETSFSVQLADGTPVLRGLCVVLQSWTTPDNPFKTPGVRLGIKRLTANSMQVFERLLVSRNAAKPAANPVASLVAAAQAAPKAVGKSPHTETLPTKLPPSRVELKQPSIVRPSTAPIVSVPSVPPLPPVSVPAVVLPIRPRAAAARSAGVPEPVSSEPTDVIEEKTDVREAKVPPAAAPSAPAAATAKVADDEIDTLVKSAADLNQALALDAPKPATPKDAAALVGAVASPLDIAEPTPDDTRTPGSDLVLPANPLMNLSDESLEGYVDCTLYEETGNFFPVDDDGMPLDDVVVPPPPVAASALAPRPLIARQPTPASPTDVVPATGFELNPETELAAARFETSPKAKAYGDGAAVTNAESSPAIPPPTPSNLDRDAPAASLRDLARGSTPAFDAAATPVLVAEPAAPRLSKRGWLMMSGVGVLVAAGALAVVTMRSVDNESQAAPVPTTPQPKQNVVAPAVEQPTQESAEAAEADEADVPPPSEDGPPVVGSGPCKLVVNTTPAGSIIRLDDNKLGPSPITIATTCDKHKLDVSHARYQAASRQVTLTEGKVDSIDVTLTRPTHVVSVNSTPPGATIFIDGRRAGTTPTKLSVLGFVTLKLEFKKTGYQPTIEKLYSRYPADKVSVKLTKW